MKPISILSIVLTLIAVNAVGCGPQASRPQKDPRHDLARRYGMTSFDQVEILRFTFNAQVGTKTVRRTWIWKPRARAVTAAAANERPTVTFTHPPGSGQIDDGIRKLDAQFVNDIYWLLFPLHLVWDTTATVEDRGRTPRPMGDGQARRIVVSYPPEGGYTPGDVYELFIDDDGLIAEWIYRRGGATTPTRMSTWEDHRRLGPLLVSLDHQGPDGFRVWFSDVALMLRNGEDWLYPAN
jgi:hypothetical protein